MGRVVHRKPKFFFISNIIEFDTVQTYTGGCKHKNEENIWGSFEK
jgi:hypothetical protein